MPDADLTQQADRIVEDIGNGNIHLTIFYQPNHKVHIQKRWSLYRGV